MAKLTLDAVGNLRNEATGLEVINDNFDLIEAEFENTLSRDGSSPNTMGANLDMNSNRVINLPSAVAVTEPVRLGDLTLVLSEALEELPDGIDIGLISITPEVQAWLTDPTSAKLATAVSDETGTAGALVFSNGPTMTLQNATGLPLTTGVIGVLPIANGGTNAITAPLARGTLAATPIASTSVSNPDRTGASGQLIPTMQEDWFTSNSSIWMRSEDTSIHPANVRVTGTWLAGDVARIRFNTGAVNYDFAYTVLGGDTNVLIATGLRTAILANSTFTALPVYVQAVSSNASFDVNFMYAQHPITLTENGSTTAAGTFTLTQSANLLDGPVGFHIQRSLFTARAPVAEDNIGSILWWGPYDAGSNGVIYGRIDTYIADPALASLQGRMQFLTGDSTVSDALNRMAIRKGVYTYTSAGASPSGGTGGDMGAGTFNTPDATGYYVNGMGFFRANSANLQLINNNGGGGVVQIGTAGVAIVNVGSTAFYPETTAVTNLGIASTREWNDLFLAEGSVINWDNGDVTITQTGNVLSFAGATTRYEFDTTIAPTSSDGAALGTTALMFSDLFLASGAVINFNNGDVTATHAANTLTFAGASSGYAFDAPILLSGTPYIDWPEIAAPSNPAANTARMYAKDDAGATKLFFRDSAGTETEMGGGGGSSGALVLIQTQTATASAQLDFETGLDDTYDAYEMRFSSIIPATDDTQLQLQVKVSGSYQTTGYISGGLAMTSGAATAAISLTTAVLLSQAGANGGVGNAAGENLNGVVRFSNPEVSQFCVFEGQTAYKRGDAALNNVSFSGQYNTAGAVTGIRIKFSSGNITSGRISLYGITKS